MRPGEEDDTVPQASRTQPLALRPRRLADLGEHRGIQGREALGKLGVGIEPLRARFEMSIYVENERHRILPEYAVSMNDFTFNF